MVHGQFEVGQRVIVMVAYKEADTGQDRGCYNQVHWLAQGHLRLEGC
jgi:hypothetical protein